MAGYVIADISVHDAATFDDYRKLVPQTIANHGGRYIVRGGAIESVEGSWQPKRLVMIEFPSVAQAKQWYHSEEYQKILPLRLKASTGHAIFVEGL